MKILYSQHFKKYSTFLWPTWLQMKNSQSLESHAPISYASNFIFLAVFKAFSLFLDFFQLILFRIFWVAQMYKFRPFNKFGKSSAIQIYFFTSHSFCSPFLTPVRQMSDVLVLSHQSLRFCSFFPNHFTRVIVQSSDWIIFRVHSLEFRLDNF